MNGIIFTNRQIAGPRRGSGGFSLIELLVGVALGLFLLFGVVTVFEKTIRGSTGNVRSARLNQELSSAMEMMVNDIRRAGYTNNVAAIYSNASTGERTVTDVNIPSTNCILYSYNEDLDNVLDAAEGHGFKLAASGAVQFGTSVTDFTDCDSGTWSDLTDPNVVNVTALEFSTTGSKCINRGPADPGVPIAYWVTTGTGATEFPCDAEAGDDVSYFPYDVDTGFATTPDPDYVAPVAGNRTVETRQVNILLSGELVSDDAVEKDLRAEVKVRNNFSRTHD